MKDKKLLFKTVLLHKKNHWASTGLLFSYFSCFRAGALSLLNDKMLGYEGTVVY